MNGVHFVVKGEDRAEGAIGAFEPFEMKVYTDDRDEAADIAVRSRNANGRQDVHVRHVSGKVWE